MNIKLIEDQLKSMAAGVVVLRQNVFYITAVHYEYSLLQNTIDLLAKTGQKFGVTVDGSCSSGRLPPSSLHSFLKANISLPGVIITNHGSQYTNK